MDKSPATHFKQIQHEAAVAAPNVETVPRFSYCPHVRILQLYRHLNSSTMFTIAYLGIRNLS